MQPTLVREPFHRPGWVYEEKVDGYRMLVYKDGDHVRLVSRNGRDHTRRFADRAGAARLPVVDDDGARTDGSEPMLEQPLLPVRDRLVLHVEPPEDVEDVLHHVGRKRQM
jgi:hypothetical protein